MAETLVEPKPDTPEATKGDAQKHEIKQVQIPLTGAPWGIIQLPVPMTEENWGELEEFLKLMKGPITSTRQTLL